MQDAHIHMHGGMKKTFGQQPLQQSFSFFFFFSSDLLRVIVYSICHRQAIKAR